MFLPTGMVDRGLAAHGRVDLGEQGRGHLDEGHAALVDRRGETGEIADHAAAQRDDRGIALAALLDQGVKDLIERLPALVGFAVGQRDRDHADPAPFQRAPQRREIERGDGGVGDDHRPLLRQPLHDQLGPAEQARADVDRVAAAAQGDFEGQHDGLPLVPAMRRDPSPRPPEACRCSCCSTRCTRLVTLWLPVSTMTSARLR